MLKPHKFNLVTKCCGGSIYRERKIVKCQTCEQPASFWRKDINYVSLPISRRPEDKTLANFPPYKPVMPMSHAEREQEAFKRLQLVQDYEASKPIDLAEANFIQERIVWNNDRIALLLG